MLFIYFLVLFLVAGFIHRESNSAAAAGLFRIAREAYGSPVRALAGQREERRVRGQGGNEGGFNQIRVH